MLRALDEDDEIAVFEPVLAGVRYCVIAKIGVKRGSRIFPDRFRGLYRRARRHPSGHMAVGFELHESNRLLAEESASLLGKGVLGMKRNEFPKTRHLLVVGSERGRAG